LRPVPLLAFHAYKAKSSQRTREKWNSQIDEDAVGDLADADIHYRSLKPNQVGRIVMKTHA